MKAIVFDFDGVLQDTFDLGYEIYKEINPNVSQNDYRNLFEGNIFDKINNSDGVRSFFREKELEAFKKLKMKEEVREELEYLRKVFELYIITSNSIKNLEIYFKNNELAGFFKDVLTEETHKLKTEKFKILFDRYGFDASSCVFVTDTLGDVIEANKVGVSCIGCAFGFHDENVLSRGNPSKIVSSFEELKDVLKEFEK